MKLTDKQCIELLNKLDEISRSFDSYEYGLPIMDLPYYEEPRAELIKTVKEFINNFNDK